MRTLGLMLAVSLPAMAAAQQAPAPVPATEGAQTDGAAAEPEDSVEGEEIEQIAHVLAAHERDVTAEAVHEGVDQPAPMLVLLGRHVGEHLGAVGILVAQAVGVVGEDAAVLLLAADR